MKKILLLACTVIVLCLQACISANIQSNKQATYTRQPKKVYFIVNAGSESKKFTANFINSLQKALMAKGIENNGHQYDPLSLDSNEDIEKRINGYDPEALLIIKQTRVTMMNGGAGAGVFEVGLVDKETKKQVWKGVLDVTGPFTMPETASKAVKTLMQKMQQDKLVI
ncbi:hypothetical protein EOD41_18375 [Mucilaginibacter limnophilus]|uniref:Lipoprotein n=1 Tax=Mucilaginibacter limnophilus TaxID=1932778 RepID=A0A3S2VKD6_9SPHI|nr:hypothetical protein [Mucilaginibacter limnophilus]RVT98054.1 hypothetical protein EOD41_18375 [Mucilaginibacter limnophilus]